MTKSEQRRLVRQKLAQFPEESCAIASARIASRLRGLLEFEAARAVALFAPLPIEPQIQALFQAATGVVAFPRIDEITGRLILYRVRTWDELIPGKLGVIEPDPARCPPLPLESLDLVLVPGMAFDRTGTRLGRGGGYYDRLLAELPQRTFRLGCFFACQEIPGLIRETHDQPLNGIVTESEEILVSWPGRK